MPQRPKLSFTSFLANLFSPAKNLLPTGLRKRPVKAASSRKSVRVAAYNRMSAQKQEMLFQSGLREAYLRGDATLRDAKEALRPKGIAVGVAKPLRNKRVVDRRARRRALDAFIAAHLTHVIRDAGRPARDDTITKGVQYIPDEEYEAARYITYTELKYKGRKGSEYEIILPDGTVYNPYWYH